MCLDPPNPGPECQLIQTDMGGPYLGGAKAAGAVRNAISHFSSKPGISGPFREGGCLGQE